MYLFFVAKMGLFTRPLALIHPDKLELLNANTDTFWMSLEP